MAQSVPMPALGESVTEGTVTQWLKSIGDRVEIDEPIVEISTDKVDTEIPSPVAGILTKILVEEDGVAEVGDILAEVSAEDEAAAAPSPAAPSNADAAAAPTAAPAEPAPAVPSTAAAAPAPAAAAPAPAPASTPAAQPTPPAPVAAPAPAAPALQVAAAPAPASTPAPVPPVGAGYVTPLVRKLAADHSVDLSRLSGSGVGGRIRREDVVAEAKRLEAEAAAAAESARRAREAAVREVEQAPPSADPFAGALAAVNAHSPAAPGAVRAAELPPVDSRVGTTAQIPWQRGVLAQRMVTSQRNTAQLTVVTEIDVTRIARLIAGLGHEFQARHGVALTFLPFILRAALDSLQAHPTLNASIEGDHVHYHPEVNLALTVDTKIGPVTPVLHNAGALSLAELATASSELAQRLRDGQIGPEQLAGGTFTVTNPGTGDALFETPIVSEPQVAMLSVGAIVKRPVVITDAQGNDAIAIRSMAYLALTYDHRLVDAPDAGRFLATLRARLEGVDFSDQL